MFTKTLGSTLMATLLVAGMSVSAFAASNAKPSPAIAKAKTAAVKVAKKTTKQVKHAAKQTKKHIVAKRSK